MQSGGQCRPLVLQFHQSIQHCYSFISHFSTTTAQSQAFWVKMLCSHIRQVLLQVSMSNWEARTLSSSQIQYAALDALLTGQVFRGLRLWHSAPSVCATCHQTLGEMQPQHHFFCTNENCKSRTFGSWAGLESHTKRVAHSPSVARCRECGRIHLKDTA